MKDVAKKYNAERYIQYRHKITAAVWNDLKGKWDLKVQNENGIEFADECDVFVNAGGLLK